MGKIFRIDFFYFYQWLCFSNKILETVAKTKPILLLSSIAFADDAADLMFLGLVLVDYTGKKNFFLVSLIMHASLHLFKEVTRQDNWLKLHPTFTVGHYLSINGIQCKVHLRFYQFIRYVDSVSEGHFYFKNVEYQTVKASFIIYTVISSHFFFISYWIS